ncbi:MAG TPA: S-methyl-5-thioribose-1-phosphate isomerase [Candidatus Cloacimonadota bacterium]|nr:S-methyl-5-thioribose-1-phosphate isomerase [Candidatus Cloacimonadota bacterium]
MLINGTQYRSVWWEDDCLCMIDQNKLPFEFSIVRLETYQQVAEAIRHMTVRGAPAIGAAGAYGLAMAARVAPDGSFRSFIREAKEFLASTRPTAIDLYNALEFVYDEVLKFIPNYDHARQVALLSAEDFVRDSAAECLALGEHGADLIEDGDRILTHCNAGALATVDWGTALSPIRLAHRQGKKIFVYVDETRPRFQGARLTAFELEQEGIPHAIITDAAAGYFFWKREIDLVIVGADRICLNGDIANKIGTYEKAVLAKEHKVPFWVAAPLSTFDLNCPSGEKIPIEYRDETEIKQYNGQALSNPGSSALNPGFDITPADYITGIITPKGVFLPKEASQKVQI